MNATTHRHRPFSIGPSAMEVWRMALGLRCTGCKSKAIVVVAKTFYPTLEAAHRFPQVAAELIAEDIRSGGGGSLPSVRFKDGKDYTLISTVAACSPCRKQLEVAAARAPHSWAVVEFDRGPGEDRPFVAVS